VEAYDKKALEMRLEECRSGFSKLASEADRDLAELLKLIHQPPWTTPAEAMFALAIAESMLAQTKSLGELGRAFVAGGRAVGQR
jgi:hypothetical protein